MTAELCKPCAIKMADKGVSIKPAGGRCEKITCAECGRRRFGISYQISEPENTEEAKKE